MKALANTSKKSSAPQQYIEKAMKKKNIMFYSISFKNRTAFHLCATSGHGVPKSATIILKNYLKNTKASPTLPKNHQQIHTYIKPWKKDEVITFSST